MFSRSQAVENSRRYLLSLIEILQKTVLGGPDWKEHFTRNKLTKANRSCINVAIPHCRPSFTELSSEYRQFRDGPLEKLLGEGFENFQAAGIFFVIKFRVWIFLGRSMNIFRANWLVWIFFHLIFPYANIFFVLRPPPPISFANGPSLRGTLSATENISG